MFDIVRSLKNADCKDFVRLIIFDNDIQLDRISEGKVVDTIETTVGKNGDIFEYLKSNKAIPIEIVIYSYSMSCQSIIANKLKESDLMLLATNMLSNAGTHSNIVCYERRFSYRSGTICICDMRLNSAVFTTLQELLVVKNSVIAVSCWPAWITSSYFAMYPSDVAKFSVSLFVVECTQHWEIIVLYNKRYVCYRHGNVSDFSKSTEIENTMKHITQMLGVDPSDIVIYSIEKSMMENFTQSAKTDMKVISRSGKLKVLYHSGNLNRAISSACSLLFAYLLIGVVVSTVQLFNYQWRIHKISRTISAADEQLAQAAKMWKCVDIRNCVGGADFREALRQHVVQHNMKKLRNASMKLDELTNKISISAVTDEEQ
ncbi:MAG: hypothetical protein LBF56_00695 [Holosporales bacterium]|jgi:hypothetical protein|nr:hypothetical protein [Holosporales bacterium]